MSVTTKQRRRVLIVVELSMLITAVIALLQIRHRSVDPKVISFGNSTYPDTQILPKASVWPLAISFINPNNPSDITTGALEDISSLFGQSMSQECLTTWQRICIFAASGDIRTISSISDNDLARLASFVAGDANRPRLLALLSTYFQIPSSTIPQDPESLVDFLTAWFKAARGDSIATTASIETRGSRRLTPISFSCITSSSGQIASTQSLFHAGVPRIYGVFENHSWKSGLSLVFAVWRDFNRNNVIFQEFEPILPQAAVNYVWLSLGQGWPSGNWQLELYDPKASFTLLATGAFSTR